jgi:hypothetical protein
MAIVFPRAMPLIGVRTADFAIVRTVSSNRLASGKTQTREYASPIWRASVTYPPLGRARIGELQAWLDSLRGGSRLFLAHHPLRPFPIAYPRGPALVRAGGGAFDWTGTVTAIDVANAALGLASLPAGFKLAPGDMIGLVEAGRYGLFRAIEPVTAGGGGTLTVTVEPRPIAGRFTTGAAVNFKRPACIMIVDPSSTSAAETAATHTPVSFSAVETVF